MIGRAAAIALVALVAGSSHAAARTGVPRVPHVVLVVLENHERDQVFGGTEAPVLQAAAKKYVDLTAYTAVAHPSLPNYLALVSGSTQGITSDCTTCIARGPSIGSLLTRAHRRWGGYAEGYPSSPGFAKKHMPFLYFPGQAGGVHPLSALDPKHLPAFALVAPDLCNDAHDCPLSTADRFLAHLLPPLLAAPGTVVFVVFDEGTTSVGGGGRVAAVALGTAVRRHTESRMPCNHYCLLATISDALGVARLGDAVQARPLTSIWRR